MFQSRTLFKLSAVARLAITTTKKKGAQRYKAGWLELGGTRHFYRSLWERNIARYYQWLKERGQIKQWEFEPKCFWFNEIKRGVRSYLPDFRITENSGRQHWVELKGNMDARSRTKLSRFARYYPKEEMTVLEAAEYYAIAKKVKGLIPDWE